MHPALCIGIINSCPSAGLGASLMHSHASGFVDQGPCVCVCVCEALTAIQGGGNTCSTDCALFTCVSRERVGRGGVVPQLFVKFMHFSA